MAKPYLVLKNFGDLITADHKVLSGNCESRDNHRYAIVVQDLATLWIQSYPCNTKTSQETQRSLQKFLEPDRKPKFMYTDNSLEFDKTCEDLKLETPVAPAMPCKIIKGNKNCGSGASNKIKNKICVYSGS